MFSINRPGRITCIFVVGKFTHDGLGRKLLRTKRWITNVLTKSESI